MSRSAGWKRRATSRRSSRLHPLGQVGCLEAFAARLLSPRTMDNLVDAAIADMQAEHEDASRRGLTWRKHWIRLRGYLSIFTMIVANARAVKKTNGGCTPLRGLSLDVRLRRPEHGHHPCIPAPHACSPPRPPDDLTAEGERRGPNGKGTGSDRRSHEAARGAAFGSTHSKEDLWAIATFVERFDEMTPGRYEQWIKESGGKAGSRSH